MGAGRPENSPHRVCNHRFQFGDRVALRGNAAPIG